MEIKVQKNVSLKKFCTYRTGGNALYFAEARSEQEIIGLREFARSQEIPFYILGGGSNTLFPDDDYPGLIIHNKMTEVKIMGECIAAQAGVNLTKLLLKAAEHNLGGLSGLINVPGSVGGAIYGNAGIPDIRISDVLLQAVILPANENQAKTVNVDYFEFGYRHSKIKQTKDIILSGLFKFKSEPNIKIRAEINQYSKARALRQPTGLSCGSFFKNPGQFPSAGWLIEQAGCKGLSVGGAVISQKHANWIMNTGTATTKDIVTLAKKVHQLVKEKFNVDLEPEVQIINKTQILKNF